MLRLYNTLTHRLEEFKPQKAGEVSLYSCGPTVYSFYHVGNLRNAVFNDTLRRTLELNGYFVRHVTNITDVGHLTSDADEGEDKLEKGAQAAGKSVSEVAHYYTGVFKKDMAELNILPPTGYKGKQDNYARATDFIADQIKILEILLEKDFAYQTKQALYFDVAKLSDYGKLTGQKLSDKETAARPEVVTDPAKKNPQDFALWFFTVGHFAGHSMHWPSPWGDGFPGWHLECSAIIHATLGDPIDIHTGAVDLIGTHHTNEIAQTEAAFGNGLSKFWVHNEYVLVDGRKMAKSRGNFYTLSDVEMRGYKPLALRLLFLQSHYRSQLNFTWESLGAAAQNLKDLEAWADLRFQPQSLPSITSSESKGLMAKVLATLNDDLNSAAALAALNELSAKVRPDGELLNNLDLALGLGLASGKDVSQNIKDIIANREKARAAKDWPKADQLRAELNDAGIEINDTETGPVWSRR